MSTIVYVVAKMVQGDMEQRKEIFDALMNDDWFSSELAALATMDQYNGRVLEELSDRHYKQAMFHVYGVFKLENTGLAGIYDN